MIYFNMAYLCNLSTSTSKISCLCFSRTASKLSRMNTLEAPKA